MIEAFAWPAVGLLLGLVVIFTFRGPIVRKIERITRAGKDGVTFEHPQDAEPLQSETLSFDQLMKQPISATVLEREKVASTQLSKLPLKTDAERIAILVRVFATANVELEYTRIAHAIFGSQLNLLVQLAGTRHGVRQSIAESLYANATVRYPELYAERPFTVWLAYLQSSNLLTSHDTRLDITQYGTDFLKFLVDARLAYDRHG